MPKHIKRNPFFHRMNNFHGQIAYIQIEEAWAKRNHFYMGGTLSGCVWWLGAALAGLITLELHRRQSTDHVAEMKNKER